MSVVPTASASHDAAASIEIRQEPHPEDDECKRFVVEVDDASDDSVTVQIWKHGEGTAPDEKLLEEEVEGVPDGDGFDVEAGPYDRSDILGATTDLYVRVSWSDDDGFHSLVSDFFNIECEGGPGPIPDCPDNVRAEALPNSTIRLEWDAVEGAESYHVFIATNEIPFVIQGSTEDTVFWDESLEPDDTVIYTVRAFADGSESIGCEHVEVTAIPFFGAPLMAAIASVGAIGAYAWMRRRT